MVIIENKIRIIVFLIICILTIFSNLFFFCSPIDTSKIQIISIPDHKNNCGSDCTTPKRSQSCIQSIIGCEAQNLKNIYENALKRNKSISGKLNVKFIINPNGTTSIKESTVNTVNDSIFVMNVLNEIELWKFPEIDSQAVEVIYPFIFEKATRN